MEDFEEERAHTLFKYSASQNQAAGVLPDSQEFPEQEPARQPVRKASVFISHKQKAEEDDDIAKRLKTELCQRGFDVYLDLDMRPGTPWEKVLKDKIESADFLLVLLSEQANQSGWVKEEIEHAYQRQLEYGRPIIVPIRIGLLEYDLRIGARLSGIQHINWDQGDFSELLEQVLYALDETHKPIREISAFGMESFLISDYRKSQSLASFVEPSGRQYTSDLLKKNRLLWISGDDGVRNYLALSLAIKEQGKAVYDVSKPRLWSKINNTLISNSAIIFRDVEPAFHFDEEDSHKEFGGLRAMLERNNMIIITTDGASFAEISREMNKLEINQGFHLDAPQSIYDEEAKRHIFEKLLYFAKENNKIRPNQFEWACNLAVHPSKLDRKVAAQKFWIDGREMLRQRIRDWSPGDIEYFITLSLPQVKSPTSLTSLLQQKLALEQEVHSWFISLDASTGCFVMALTMFARMGAEELWAKCKAIRECLRIYDPQLALVPLEISREHADPYVTSEGPIDFVDERIASIIRQEVTRSWREYFIEILPKLQEWSVPLTEAGYNEAGRRKKIEENKDIRIAIARTVGLIGKQHLNDISGILDFWATDHGVGGIKIREAAAIALEEMSSDITGVKQALNTLESWCNDFTAGENSLARVWTAAVALGRIIQANPTAHNAARAIECLRALTYDNRYGVRFHVSIALKTIARKMGISVIEPLVERLARKGDVSAKMEKRDTRVWMNLADAINLGAQINSQAALAIYHKWVASQEANLKWVAYFSLITRKRQQSPSANKEKFDEIKRVLGQDAKAFLGVLLEAIDNSFYRQNAEKTFIKIAQELTEDSRRELVLELAQFPFNDFEAILSSLRSSNSPGLDSLLVGILEESWKNLIETPARFIEVVGNYLSQAQNVREGVNALASMVRPEPNGYGHKLVAMLAGYYSIDRSEVDEFLSLLKQLEPHGFQSLIFEVCARTCKGMLQTPKELIHFVGTSISNPNFSNEMLGVLEYLAHPEPQGDKEQLLECLIAGYGLEQTQVQNLMTTLRLSGSATLRDLTKVFNYRVLENHLSNPVIFLLKVREWLGNEEEAEEVLDALNELATPEPYGRRSKLADALAQARQTQSFAVDSLLTDYAFKSRPNLASLYLKVRILSIFRRFFFWKSIAIVSE